MGWDDVRLGSLAGAFEDVVRVLIRDKDVLPCLEDMRAGLLDRLDG